MHNSEIEQKTSPIPVSATATAVGKEKSVLEVTNTAESSHLSLEAVVVQEELVEAMRTVYCGYAENFRDLHETHELQGGKDMSEVRWSVSMQSYV